MLGSAFSWSAESNDAAQWMKIDAGSETTVLGVRIKGRKIYNGGQKEYVTAVTVQYKKNKDSKWMDVMSGEDSPPTIFSSTSGNFDAIFPLDEEGVQAQYIKINVKSYVGSVSMRAGLLIKPTLSDQTNTLTDGPGEAQKLTEALRLTTVQSIAVAVRKAKEKEFDAATLVAAAAAAAALNAAVYDKLTGKMIFIGVSINHSPHVPNTRIRCLSFHPGADALQLGRVLSGDSYETRAENGT